MLAAKHKCVASLSYLELSAKPECQDAIDELLTIMYSTITYLTTKGSFKQVSEALPITQTIPGRDDPATYEARRKELALDLLKKAKQLEILITHFPSATEADQHFEAQYEGLQSELRSVKQEYEQELQHAGQCFFIYILLKSLQYLTRGFRREQSLSRRSLIAPWTQSPRPPSSTTLKPKLRSARHQQIWRTDIYHSLLQHSERQRVTLAPVKLDDEGLVCLHPLCRQLVDDRTVKLPHYADPSD